MKIIYENFYFNFQLTEIVDYGRRLQFPYVQKVIEFYELKPSHFNSTEEIFCDVFDCPKTTTVTENEVTTPTSIIADRRKDNVTDSETKEKKGILTVSRNTIQKFFLIWISRS